MLDAIYPSLMSSLGLQFSGTGETPGRTANRHSGLAESPYNVYPAADGYLALICVTDAHWSALLTAMSRPDLAARGDLASRAGRVARLDEVDELVSAWTAGLGKDELAGRLREAGVPCGPCGRSARSSPIPICWSAGCCARSTTRSTAR
jgi:CoA:oxalate CoA-transferase